MTTVKTKTVSGKPLKPVPLWAYPLGLLGFYALFAFPEDSAPDWMERFIVSKLIALLCGVILYYIMRETRVSGKPVKTGH